METEGVRGWRAAFAALLLLGLSVGTQAAALPSVASTNLCADLLLVAIADPGQIRALSRQYRAPHPYSTNGGRVEELLHLKPELALVYQGWAGRRHSERLGDLGVTLVALPYPRGWADALSMARETAARIGRAEAMAARLAAMDRRMAELAGVLPPLSALYLRPGGGSAGEGTYVDALFSHLGLRNAARELGVRGWGRVPLERLLMDPPDLLVLGYFERGASLHQSAYVRHPRVAALLELTPSIQLDGDAWGCGGLELLDVAERLVAEIQALGLEADRTP